MRIWIFPVLEVSRGVYCGRGGEAQVDESAHSGDIWAGDFEKPYPTISDHIRAYCAITLNIVPKSRTVGATESSVAPPTLILASQGSEYVAIFIEIIVCWLGPMLLWILGHP
jgi:hypothetical protein